MFGNSESDSETEDMFIKLPEHNKNEKKDIYKYDEIYSEIKKEKIKEKNKKEQKNPRFMKFIKQKAKENKLLKEIRQENLEIKILEREGKKNPKENTYLTKNYKNYINEKKEIELESKLKEEFQNEKTEFEKKTIFFNKLNDQNKNENQSNKNLEISKKKIDKFFNEIFENKEFEEKLDKIFEKMVQILQRKEINKIWENSEKIFLKFFFDNKEKNYGEIFIEIKEKYYKGIKLKILNEIDKDKNDFLFNFINLIYQYFKYVGQSDKNVFEILKNKTRKIFEIIFEKKVNFYFYLFFKGILEELFEKKNQKYIIKNNSEEKKQIFVQKKVVKIKEINKGDLLLKKREKINKAREEYLKRKKLKND